MNIHAHSYLYKYIHSLMWYRTNICTYSWLPDASAMTTFTKKVSNSVAISSYSSCKQIASKFQADCKQIASWLQADWKQIASKLQANCKQMQTINSGTRAAISLKVYFEKLVGNFFDGSFEVGKFPFNFERSECSWKNLIWNFQLNIRLSNIKPTTTRLSNNMQANSELEHSNLATSMLVTDVGDEMWWWQFEDFGDDFGDFGHQHPLFLNISVGHQHRKDVT